MLSCSQLVLDAESNTKIGESSIGIYAYIRWLADAQNVCSFLFFLP